MSINVGQGKLANYIWGLQMLQMNNVEITLKC